MVRVRTPLLVGADARHATPAPRRDREACASDPSRARPFAAEAAPFSACRLDRPVRSCSIFVFTSNSKPGSFASSWHVPQICRITQESHLSPSETIVPRFGASGGDVVAARSVARLAADAREVRDASAAEPPVGKPPLRP